MDQIAELNKRLSVLPTGSQISASDLGLEGAHLTRSRNVTRSSHGTLAGSAVLVRLSWDGAPEFPYIHGHFSDSAATDGVLKVDLHTLALRNLSKRLHAQHTWGQGSIPD